MTISYQSLKEYGYDMTLNGASVPMDIAVTLVGVIFPPEGVCLKVQTLFIFTMVEIEVKRLVKDCSCRVGNTRMQE